jgi:thiamine transport system substrate-binding protein
MTTSNLRPTRLSRRALAGLSALGLALGLAACSPGASGQGGETTGSAEPQTLTVITHDSFYLPDDLVAEFESGSGYDVVFIAPGNAGTVVNQLILSADAPLADVVFGIDNTFAGRAIEAGILDAAAAAQVQQPAGALVDGADTQGQLIPVDFGDVCLNADTLWFAEHNLALPTSLGDLTGPDYAGLLVVTNPATSSPGLAFLMETVAAYGEDGFLDYWAALRDNGVRVAASWSDAYDVDFSGSSGHGDYPLVLSYATSPMYEAGDDGVSPTVTLPGTCFRQIEYAGIVAGAANPAGAVAFIDWLLSAEVQSAIPDSMYMSPVNPAATLPEIWAAYTGIVTDPYTLPAAEIAQYRDQWIADWTDTVLG